MSTIYLNAGYDGSIYESSKQPKEGFEQNVSSKGNVSYRRYLKKGLYGIYKGISLRDSKIGQQLSIHMVDQGGNNVYFQIPFKDQKGDIGTFAESIIQNLPFMEKEFLYRLFVYNMPVEGTSYSNIGISVKHANTDWDSVREDIKVGQLSYSYTKKATGEVITGDIPAVVWSKTFDGKNVADKSAKNAYLYGVLSQYGEIQQPVAAQPVAAQPVAQAPIAQQPVAQAPIAQQPVAQAPIAQQPVAAQPVAQAPIAQQPVAQAPIAQQPVAQAPIAQQPVAQAPIAQQPVAAQPVAQAPIAQQPVAQAPIAQQPVAQAPIAQQPVAQAPIAQQPVAAQPVAGAVQYVAPPADTGANDDLPF